MTVPDGGPMNELVKARDYQVLCIPVSPHWVVTMDVPRPMSEAEWQQLHVVLAVMKPGLVENA